VHPALWPVPVGIIGEVTVPLVVVTTAELG
jgi:hypothetical protein